MPLMKIDLEKSVEPELFLREYVAKRKPVLFSCILPEFIEKNLLKKWSNSYLKFVAGIFDFFVLQCLCRSCES